MTEHKQGSEGDPKPAGRRERKAAEMRERIFQAAIELIAERGLAQVTVEQITEKADVGKGTFFNYFPSKEAVLTYFGTTQVARLQEALANGEVTGSAREKTACVLELLARHADISPQLARGLFIAALSGQSAPDLHGPNIWHMQSVLAEIIREGQACGEFKNHHDPAYAAQFMLGQYFLGMLGWSTGFAPGTLVESVERFGKMALDGLGA
jgi:AcrR family transcriptional regulator